MLIYTKAIAALGLSEIAKRQGVDEVFPFTDGGVTMKAVKTQREGFADSVIEAKQNPGRVSRTHIFADIIGPSLAGLPVAFRASSLPPKSQEWGLTRGRLSAS